MKFLQTYVLKPVLLFSALFFCTAAHAAMPEEQAQQIISASGVNGGVIVHLGCGDGKLTAALRLGDRFSVHGLDTDPANIEQARANIRAAGLYGPVAVACWSDVSRLPYVDNTVNLIVAEKADTSLDEIMRVLAPQGVALIGGKKTVKPRPASLGEWSHHFHDPSNNPVADDTVVGPPRRLQWACGPTWSRHHDRMSSTSAMVSAGGRIFYIFDEGLTASLYLPSRWALIARDAFNGKELWKREIDTWYTRYKGYKEGPADAPRRLVAVGNRVWVMLGLRENVSCLDAATGKTVQEYTGTKEAEELLYDNGRLFVLCGSGSIGNGVRSMRPVERRTIVALDADSGKEYWRVTDVIAAATPALDARRLYYFNFESKQVVALDRGDGRTVWTSAPLPAPALQYSFFASRLLVNDDVVLFAGGEHAGLGEQGRAALGKAGREELKKDDLLTALDAGTGKILWQAPHPQSGYNSPADLFVIDHTVWCAHNLSGGWDGRVIGYDLKTGRELARFPPDLTTFWFHHRCYPDIATVKYLITARTGMEFIDLKAKHWDLNDWVRGTCLYGIMPANGLIYTPPAPCICYAETYLHGFNAYASAATESPMKTPLQPRLTKGPAFAQPVEGRTTPGDWPTYRGDNARSGAAHGNGPVGLSAAWTAKIGGRLSTMVVAQGMVFVAAIDEHSLYALDAASGSTVWRFSAEGRIDSPPTYVDGRIIFGSKDGYVYCLRAADGANIWRFRAAPYDRRLLCDEQLESLWPVHGSVLVRDDIAHFVAGRSAFVDGGMRLFRLKIATGEVVSESPIDDRHPETGKNLQESVRWLNLPVAQPDILSCDDRRLYMRSQSFDLNGKRLRVDPGSNQLKDVRVQRGEGAHLFCPTGFLDDSWFHRTYWLYGRTWTSGFDSYFAAGRFTPGGRIICLGRDKVFAFDRRPQDYKWTVPMGYRLYAAHKEWKHPDAVSVPGGGDTGDEGDKQSANNASGKKAKKKTDWLPNVPVGNSANYLWTMDVPVLVRAMVLTGACGEQTLYIAGSRRILDEATIPQGEEANADDALHQEAAYLGKSGGLLWAVSAGDGRKQNEFVLDSPPVFDGLIAASGRLYLAAMNGTVICIANQ